MHPQTTESATPPETVSTALNRATPTHPSHYSHSSQASQGARQLPTTLSTLADVLGSDRATVREYVERLGFRFHIELIGVRRKPAACLTTDQAAAVARAYQADLALGPLPDHTELDPPDRNYGVVYLLQLEPDCDPGRFKVGFSSKPWTRINDLLTVAPLAQCVAMWPARRNWERAAIVAIAQFATQIREEVFRGADIHDAIRAGDKFFDAMPTPRRSRRTRPAPSPPEAPPDSPNERAHSCGPPHNQQTARPTAAPSTSPAACVPAAPPMAPPSYAPTCRTGAAAESPPGSFP
jgi:hypothetical protein